MSRVNDLRNGIKAAITTVMAGKPFDLYDVVMPQQFDGAVRRSPGIALAYVGRLREPGPVGTRVQYAIRYQFHIGLVTDNYRGPINTLSEADGLEDMADRVDGIRAIPIGTSDEGEAIYLEFVSEQVSIPPNRGVEGGPAAFDQLWQTSQVLA